MLPLVTEKPKYFTKIQAHFLSSLNLTVKQHLPNWLTREENQLLKASETVTIPEEAFSMDSHLIKKIRHFVEIPVKCYRFGKWTKTIKNIVSVDTKVIRK